MFENFTRAEDPHLCIFLELVLTNSHEAKLGDQATPERVTSTDLVSVQLEFFFFCGMEEKILTSDLTDKPRRKQKITMMPFF